MAEQADGYWLRSADGGLYFIPRDSLDSFRVPEDVAEPALREIDQLEPAEVAGYSAGAAAAAKPWLIGEGSAQRPDAAKPWVPSGDLSGLRLES